MFVTLRVTAREQILVIGRLSLGQGAQSALRNGSWLIGSYWIESVLRLVYAVAIARTLGADEFGIWSYTIALYTFLIGLLGFGMETQLPLSLGRGRSRQRDVVRTALMVRWTLLSVAACVLVLLAFATASGTTRLAILIAVPAVLGRGSALFAHWTFTGLERTRLVFRATVLVRVPEILIGLALLSVGFGIIVLLFVHAMAWLAEGLFALWMLSRETGGLRGRFDRRLMKVMVARGLPLGVAGGFNQWLTSGPILLVKLLSGDLAIVGQFALAQQIAVIAATTFQKFISASLPIIGRASKRRDGSADRFGYLSGLAAVTVFGAAAVVAYVLGPRMAELVFGGEFRLAGEFFAPFMVVGGLMLLPMGFMQLSAARAIYWPDVMSGLAGSTILLVSFPWLYAAWDIWGAMAATILAWSVKAVLATALYRSRA